METIENREIRKTEKNKVIAIVLKNKLVFLLALLLLFITTWAFIKIKSMENRFESEKKSLVTAYENKIDSLSIAGMELTSKVFSWAIRSEMTRKNRLVFHGA